MELTPATGTVAAQQPIKKSFPLACKEFFGQKQGQTAMEFMKELQALSPADKSDLISMFSTVGYEILAAAPTA